MEKTFTPERRLEIYKEAQPVLTEYGYDNGLCVVLGDVAYGSYYKAPWAYWHEMQEYLIELRHWHLLPDDCFTPTQRREILESAIAEVTELIKSKA
jgi:hypothetical protein